jgi:epsilon-lactone hydrolase
MTAQQREMIDQILRNGPFDLGGDVATQRPILEQMLTSHPLPGDVRVTPGDLGGIPVIFIDIADVEPRGTIFHIHGGGFALGSAGSSVGLASDLARKTRMRAVAVDYQLAPEHPYPAATLRPPTTPCSSRAAPPITSSCRASRPGATSPSSSLSPTRRRA